MKAKNVIFLLVTGLFMFSVTSCGEDPEPLPVASFATSTLAAEVGDPIQFTNNSQFAETFLWDFGDGESSTLRSPSHVYATAGTFTVELTATGAGGVHSTTVSVTISFPPPVAGFTMSKSEAETGEPVTFTNTSQNASSWQWDFGDGNTSTEENPSHTYSQAGTFDVKLTAIGDGGENSIGDSIVVKVSIDGDWRASTTESDTKLSSASLSFTVDGTSVSISQWSLSTSFGYFWGMNWSSTLDENNTFTLVPSSSVKFSIKLGDSNSNESFVTYSGKDYSLAVTKK